MKSTWIMSALCALAFALAPVRAYAADDDNEGDAPPATASTDHADPSTKTLPSHASATAQANAFGQQGARQKAAHQAARAAAAQEAQRATHDTGAAAGANGEAHSAGHAHGANPQAAKGQARAFEARTASHTPDDHAASGLDHAAQGQAHRPSAHGASGI